MSTGYYNLCSAIWTEMISSTHHTDRLTSTCGNRSPTSLNKLQAQRQSVYVYPFLKKKWHSLILFSWRGDLILKLAEPTGKKFSEWGGHYHNSDPPHRRGNHKLHPTYEMNTRDLPLLPPNQEVEDIWWSSCNRWHIYTVHPTLLIFIAISKNIVKAHTRKMGIPVCFAARNIAVAHSLTYWEEKDGKCKQQYYTCLLYVI